VSRIGGVLSSLLGGAYFAVRPVPSASYFFYVLAAVILVVVASFASLRTHIGSRKAALAPAV
jgi:AAHS family 4-hydroxybenzoate transporter-like MFS transporter